MMEDGKVYHVAHPHIPPCCASCRHCSTHVELTCTNPAMELSGLMPHVEPFEICKQYVRKSRYGGVEAIDI